MDRRDISADALDPMDLYQAPGINHATVVTAGGPVGAVHLNAAPSFQIVDLFNHDGLLADQRIHICLELIGITLPPEQRTAVVLFYYEDLSLREIARTLRVPEGTVKSRLSRGRGRLRTLLSEDAAEKEDTT